jgi:septum formation protein
VITIPVKSNEKRIPEAPGSQAARIILASTSETRQQILAAAGIDPVVRVSGVDEDEIKRALGSEGATAEEVAMILAETKALRVARLEPEALVIGADQVLVVDGKLFDKPANLAVARETLLALRGRQHQLLSALAVARDNAVIWRHIAEAKLTMRKFSNKFLDAYLKSLGEAALTTVGGYRLDGPGVQLFNDVKGDYFTILGLPLLPLLDFLRAHNVVLK